MSKTKAPIEPNGIADNKRLVKTNIIGLTSAVIALVLSIIGLQVYSSNSNPDLHWVMSAVLVLSIGFIFSFGLMTKTALRRIRWLKADPHNY